MKRFLVAVAVALAGSSAAADLVNGSFELGTPNDGVSTHWTRLSPGDSSLAGWTVLSGNVDWFSAEAAQPCAGSRSLELNGNNNGAIAQSFSTRQGQRYRVTFCLAGNPNGPPAVKTLTVTASGNPYEAFGFDTTGRTLPAMGWAERSYSFTATGTTTTLEFRSATTRNDGGLNAYGPVIDAVVVQEDRVLPQVTDQWWIPAESGWGIAVLQQGDVVFIPMFVYGPDNKPTWFVGVGYHQPGAPGGHLVFAGELYAVTGPYFGGPWNAVPVVERIVGAITFDADSDTTATLTYTVDGTQVVKNVTRQTWGIEDLSGNYRGGAVWDQNCRPAGVDERDHIEIFGSWAVTHGADGKVKMTLQIARGLENGVDIPLPSGATLTLDGVYAQSGHVGRVQGTMVIVAGGQELGRVTGRVFEIERSINGLTGRFEGVGSDADACQYAGRIGGVRR